MLSPNYPVTSEPATVIVTASGALAGDTEIPVAPLTVELATGVVLDFGGVKFARLAADAAVDDETLTTDPLPSDLEPGDECELAGTTTAFGILSEAVKALSDHEQLALNISAELVLGLTAGYTGDDAEQLAVAVAHQMNLMESMGVTAQRLKSQSPASPGPTLTFRDRWIDPRAAMIVAKVTGRKAVRFEPMTVGV